MSDRAEATGQFEASTEGLFGREAEEAAAGFKKMPETKSPQPEPDEFKNPRRAAEELNNSRVPSEPDEAVSYFKTETGEKVDGTETVTLERAAADLAAYRTSKVDSPAHSI